MSDEVLRPCPICGKKVSIARTDNEVGERWWFITRGTYRTTRCNCRLFLESAKFTCDWNDDYSLECRAKLIDRWNTRAELGSESVDYMLNTIGKLEEENERLQNSCGTLTAEQVEKAIHDCSTYASYDGCTYYASGIRLQAIADELNAELGSGTCENTQHDTDFMCSVCGKCVDNGRILGFNYCPNCGRKVVSA